MITFEPLEPISVIISFSYWTYDDDDDYIFSLNIKGMAYQKLLVGQQGSSSGKDQPTERLPIPSAYATAYTLFEPAQNDLSDMNLLRAKHPLNIMHSLLALIITYPTLMQ